MRTKFPGATAVNRMRTPLALCQPLEPRRLFSATVDVSPLLGDEPGDTIAVDSAKTATQVVVSATGYQNGLEIARSVDGGITWSSRAIATGVDGLPSATGQPAEAFDSYGNLFVAYIDRPNNQLDVLVSNDAGLTFSVIGQFFGAVSDPSIACTTNGVAIAFIRGQSAMFSAAPVTGLGDIGAFTVNSAVPGSQGSTRAVVTATPGTGIMIAYQIPGSDGSARVFEDSNANPFQPSDHFSRRVEITTVNLPTSERIAAQPDVPISTEFSLAYDADLSTADPRAGVVYAVYAAAPTLASADTDIYLRYLFPGSSAWSAAVLVDAGNTSTASQFLPEVAVDSTTGDPAISWYDTRNDNGTGGLGDDDGIPDDDAELRATVISPVDVPADSTGLNMQIASSIQISSAASSARDTASMADFGAATGIAFTDENLDLSWADNSEADTQNPNGALHGLNTDYTSVADAAFQTASGMVFRVSSLSTPGKPKAADASAAGANDVSWTAATDPVGPITYQLQYEKSGSQIWTTGATSVSTSVPLCTTGFTDTNNIQPNTVYRLRVMASDAAGNTSISAMSRFKTQKSLIPSALKTAYGLNSLYQRGLTGAGETIGLVEIGDDPELNADLSLFDKHFKLPSFTPQIFNQYGENAPASADSNDYQEICLDVEWAHAIAPGAKVVVVEATPNDNGQQTVSNLATAAVVAASYAQVVSISYGFPEGLFSETGSTSESSYDQELGSTGLFVAAAGDNYGLTHWPSVSPDVLSVGGTQLSIGPVDGNENQVVWQQTGLAASVKGSGSSFGVSSGEASRTTPDVSYVADGYSYYTGGNLHTEGFGTSFGAPQWAALIALADEARHQNGLAPLESVGAGNNSVQSALAQAPSADWNKVSEGSAVVGGFKTPTGALIRYLAHWHG